MFNCKLMATHACVESGVLNEILYEINIFENSLFVEMTFSKT